MNWISTRNPNIPFQLSEVLFKGLAPDGGLFMPEHYPTFQFQRNGQKLTDTAFEFLSPYFSPEIPEPALKTILKNALDFEIPLVRLSENLSVLELFHGPTLAFKDVGARIMAGLMDYLYNADKPITILAATSGDTGSAVASAFLGRQKFRVVLLYPSGKVSKIQEQQLTTFGQNVTALEIDGTFDDCQNLVKEAFSDEYIRTKKTITSANSISIGRWLPQAVYYLHAWNQFGSIHPTAQPMVSVPSGNLGNIAAGLLTLRHRAGFSQLAAACNANKTFPDFLNSGKFEPRPSVSTPSNAMDVGNPSNFERIFHMFDKNRENITAVLSSQSISNEKTLEMVQKIHQQFGYVCCPHTAVGFSALFENEKFINEHTFGIVLSTAHPAKFGDVIEPVLKTKIPLHGALNIAMSKKKESVKLSSKYNDFKNWLIDENL